MGIVIPPGGMAAEYPAEKHYMKDYAAGAGKRRGRGQGPVRRAAGANPGSRRATEVSAHRNFSHCLDIREKRLPAHHGAIHVLTTPMMHLPGQDGTPISPSKTKRNRIMVRSLLSIIDSPSLGRVPNHFPQPNVVLNWLSLFASVAS